ncbi:Protein CBG18387 [Caenorhabditis briggsae]|uniref:Protein CBG18387 n=1 Tax=Caenorhabditis briggsae TaxID=6238 RepID=A8XSL1_CAEBR|nr:Protein CBG18387 [Caenorhabditis briggsae]CAP35853.1 Protein CBG18387 [Caenorhabditis briggsae]
MVSQEAGTPMESSSSTSIETSEDIQRILFRLVRADTDAKLQAVTDRYLCDVIELAAQKEEYRQLVTTEFLSPFNKMVRSNLAIRLPVVRLLQMFQGNCALSSNFSLIYLKFAKDRLEAAEQLEVLPAYLRSFSKKPTDLNYIYDIFSLCLPGLYRLAEMEKKNWPNLDMTSGDVEILARCFEAVLVFNETSRERITNALAGRLQLKDNGLCLAEFIQIARKVFPEQLNLTETKMMILKVLGKELLDDKIAFPIFVVARGSKLNEVDDLAENLLKKISTEKLVNERSVVDKLMYLYLGSETFMKKPTDPLLLVQQGPPAVQQAVLSYLTKSTEVLTAITSNVKICLFGCESIHARVQAAAMNFFNHCAEKMPDRYLKPFADKMFKTLRKLSSSDAITTLALCGTYRCVAVIGKRTPSLVLDDAAVITKMFEVLSTESVEDVSSAIVSCLTTWLPLFLESEKAELRTRLREFISEYINSESPNCRLAALKYAEALIGENDMNLRWILIQSAGDQRDSIRSEALRQLEKSLQKPTPPPSVIIGALWSSLHKDYRRAANETTNTTVNTYNSLVHQIASKYLYAVFETIVMKEAAHLRIVEGDDHWMTVAPRIVQLLHEVGNIEMIEKATELALHATVESTDVHLFRIASCFLAAFRSFSKEAVSTRFQFAVPSCVQKLRDSTRMEFSTTLAYLLSALIHDDQAARLELFTTSKLQLNDKEIPGLAFTCASMLTPLLGAQFLPPVMPSEFIKDVFIPLIKNGFQRPTSTLESTLGALVFLLQNNPTALNRKTHKEVMDDLIVNCEKIAVSRQDSFSQKTRGFCAKVIGLLSGDVENDESNFEQSRESLIRIGSGPPQHELQLIVGEAIVDCILGRWAISKRDYYLLGGDSLTLTERMKTEAQVKEVNERLVTFITEILADKKTNANQHARKAELIWLLIVVQSFSVLKADVLKNAQLLGAIQNAFTDGLTENDEFSQDISAKGMGIVYGLADGSLKKGLVESLMDTLSEGKRSETKVEGETQLFAAGQLGSTPTGGKLTTYQELLTLASDLNQPDLVYKFMQLARHNATWNSKMGAAHGFGALLENAKEEIEPYFKQLVPKLFRFRYDPDIKVQSSMKSIWGILTADRKNVVDEFANEIAKELLPALTDREYRVRESSCLALSDLLRGHDTEEMHKLIPEYLESVLRVRDDVKESVREAANRAADAISKLIIRLGSSNNLEKSNRFLSIALPALIDRGILKATVKGNRLFCLSVVLELTKHAGKQLKPYIAELIPMLMDAVSENETPLLNYIAARADTQQIEMLDDARASMAKASPMVTAVNDLLPHIDSQILIDMTPKIADTLRSSVGTSTRSSAADFVSQLALRAPQLMYDHTSQADKLFGALIPGVRDRNPSIRKQFANAMSYLAKFTSQSQMKKLIKTVVADLLGSDEELKVSSCHVISNLAENAAEVLKGYTSQIVPYVLLEKCREVPKGDEPARLKQERWNEVWSELVPSTSAAARLYKTEILDLALDLVTNSEVWSVRKQAAVMVGVLFDSLKEDAGIELARKTAFCLLRNLNGRIWDGKVEVLKSLSNSFEAGGINFQTSLQLDEAQEIVQVLRRESSRKNADYACAGLATLASWAVITEDVDSGNWLAQKVAENIGKLTGTRNDDDSDDDMEGISNLEKEIRVSQLVTLNFTALAKSLRTFQTEEQAENSLNQVADYVKNSSIAWKSKQFLFIELVKTIEKWQPRQAVNAQKLVENLLEQADELCDQQKPTVAADALLVVLRMQDRHQMFGVDWKSVIDRVDRGTAGAATGLGSRFEMKMETS